jgi:hypothetical protein
VFASASSSFLTFEDVLWSQKFGGSFSRFSSFNHLQLTKLHSFSKIDVTSLVDFTTSDCLNEMKEYPFQNILAQKGFLFRPK